MGKEVPSHTQIHNPPSEGLSMATLNLTKNCNLKCRHCYVGGKSFEKMPEMDASEVRNVIEALSKLIVNQPRLFIISGGEPTLEKSKLRQAVQVAKANDLNVRLNTNGYGVDDDLAVFLANHQVLTQVSLDGVDPKTNSLLRGSEKAFYDAIDAIKKLVEAGVRTRISFTIHSENIHQLADMINFSQDLGVEQLTTSSLVGIGNAKENRMQSVEFKEEFEVLYDSVKDDREKQMMTKSTLLAETIQAIRAGIKFSYCGTGLSTCCIDANGDVYPCINMVRDDYRSGNAAKESIEQFWENSTVLSKLRMLNVNSMNFQCAQCIFRHFCGGYCRGETLESGAELTSPYVRCKAWKQGLVKVLDILSESPDIYYFDEDPVVSVMHRE